MYSAGCHPDSYSLDSQQPTVRTGPGFVGGISIADPAGRTDLANARRLVSIHGDKLRYCYAWRKWLVWDGCRWKPDADGSADRLAKDVADLIWIDAGPLDDSCRRFATSTARASGIGAMLALAASEPGVAVAVDDLDRDPWLLNCPNGTVDLRDGTLREHCRDDLLTKLCPTKYDPDAESELWGRFLMGIFCGDSDLELYVNRLLGYGLTGSVRDHVLATFYGNGCNGKSTLLNTTMHTMGSDYATQAASELLLSTKNDRHPTSRATLHGKRLAVASETSDGRKLDEATVKALTGGDPVNARRMHEDEWNFVPTHKLILCTNHKPSITGTDHGIWRRVQLIPFNARFDNPDTTLPDRLKGEAGAILAWLVAGAVDWYERGLDPPASVQVATDAYRSESDVVGAFIADQCQVDPLAAVPIDTFHDALSKWCESEGTDCPSKRKLTPQMEDHGFQKRKSGVWRYHGLTLTA